MVKKCLDQILSFATVLWIVLHLATLPCDGRHGPLRRHFPHSSRVGVTSPPKLATLTPTNVTLSGNNMIVPFDGRMFNKVRVNNDTLNKTI